MGVRFIIFFSVYSFRCRWFEAIKKALKINLNRTDLSVHAFFMDKIAIILYININTSEYKRYCALNKKNQYTIKNRMLRSKMHIESHFLSPPFLYVCIRGMFFPLFLYLVRKLFFC